MATTKYVFGYINPDTDSVCSAIGYAELAEALGTGEFQPITWGKINKETTLVLSRFSVQAPPTIETLEGDHEIALVDTHHLAQLPKSLDPNRVVEIIDHHPAGDAAAFPRATINNEEVGAAATLIVERFHEHGLLPTVRIAGLLAAAIISNTLNFSAPSTSERDHAALAWLKPIVEIDETFVSQMFQAISDIGQLTTYELLTKDYKEFNAGGIPVGISQIEIADTSMVTRRGDLMAELRRLAQEKEAEHVFVSVIGLVAHATTVISAHQETQNLLTRALGLEFDGEVATVSRILMRKTDLIPALVRLNEKDPT